MHAVFRPATSCLHHLGFSFSFFLPLLLSCEVHSVSHQQLQLQGTSFQLFVALAKINNQLN